jgi:hypothetical protein
MTSVLFLVVVAVAGVALVATAVALVVAPLIQAELRRQRIRAAELEFHARLDDLSARTASRMRAELRRQRGKRP